MFLVQHVERQTESKNPKVSKNFVKNFRSADLKIVRRQNRYIFANFFSHCLCVAVLSFSLQSLPPLMICWSRKFGKKFSRGKKKKNRFFLGTKYIGPRLAASFQTSLKNRNRKLPERNKCSMKNRYFWMHPMTFHLWCWACSSMHWVHSLDSTKSVYWEFCCSVESSLKQNVSRTNRETNRETNRSKTNAKYFCWFFPTTAETSFLKRLLLFAVAPPSVGHQSLKRNKSFR